MIKFLIVIIVILVVHAIYNLINFLRYKFIEKKFFGMFCDNIKIRNKSLSSKTIIVNYIKFAGVSDKNIPFSQPVGYGYISTGKISVLNNISNNREDIVSASHELLLEAKGNYWSRFINSINPFYWIRVILFIPNHICTYLGIKPDSMIIKIFQLLYWIITIIFTLLISVYSNEVKDFINSLLHIS